LEKTDKLFRCMGLPRCGNHPIIFWMMHQYKEMKYDGESQYGIHSSSRFYDPEVRLSECAWMKPCPDQGGMVTLFNNRVPRSSQHVDGHVEVDKEVEHLEALADMSGVEKINKTVIFSYELQSLKDLRKYHPTDQDSLKSYLGKVKTEKNIIIMRDAYNAIASRLVMNRLNERPDESIFNYVEEYKVYAKEFLNITRTIPNKWPMCFNRWVRSVTYRRKFCEKMRLHFNDTAKNRVSKIGGGSTWDKDKFDKYAEDMDLQNRWTNLKDDEFYKSIFEDKELVVLSNKIFEIEVEF